MADELCPDCGAYWECEHRKDQHASDCQHDTGFINYCNCGLADRPEFRITEHADYRRETAAQHTRDHLRFIGRGGPPPAKGYVAPLIIDDINGIARTNAQTAKIIEAYRDALLQAKRPPMDIKFDKDDTLSFIIRHRNYDLKLT